MLHVRPEDVVERVKALVEERKQLERQLADAKKQLALGGGGGKEGGPAIIEVGGRKFLKLSVSGVEMKDLKAMADDGRAKVGSGIVAIANNSADGKLGIVVAVTTISPTRSAPSISCAPAPRRSAARAAAAVPTWRRPAAPTAAEPMRRCRRSRRGSAPRRELAQPCARAALSGTFVRCMTA